MGKAHTRTVSTPLPSVNVMLVLLSLAVLPLLGLLLLWRADCQSQVWIRWRMWGAAADQNSHHCTDASYSNWTVTCVSADLLLLLSCRAKEFMTRDKSGKLKDTGVRFQDIAGGVMLYALFAWRFGFLCCLHLADLLVLGRRQEQYDSHMTSASIYGTASGDICKASPP